MRPDVAKVEEIMAAAKARGMKTPAPETVNAEEERERLMGFKQTKKVIDDNRKNGHH